MILSLAMTLDDDDVAVTRAEEARVISLRSKVNIYIVLFLEVLLLRGNRIEYPGLPYITMASKSCYMVTH